jgi:hypothetical protein
MYKNKYGSKESQLVSQSTYDTLDKMRGKNDSFNKVIVRLIEARSYPNKLNVKTKIIVRENRLVRKFFSYYESQNPKSDMLAVSGACEANGT